MQQKKEKQLKKGKKTQEKGEKQFSTRFFSNCFEQITHNRNERLPVITGGLGKVKVTSYFQDAMHVVDSSA